ncbi:[pyruvate dehydrogenase (acetyl-transferring)] kinase [Malassezia cuniculi]|uniref:Cyclin-dependent kinase 8 n=1 Tax=Malassezia cuniculi TaxID=948313 RepID=A0AAF0J610_9BASI|nr:[pyruvate dehydrogenase (acetyl-transferring)] kinase [Malassezia cuniculi]
MPSGKSGGADVPSATAVPASATPAAVMAAYRASKDAQRRSVLSAYKIIVFLSSGTYGRVYMAEARSDGAMCAIKKFKSDKETHGTMYTGLSQSAVREIALNRELRHENVVLLREVFLENKSIYMVFEYAEYDFLRIIHHNLTVLRSPIGLPMVKSLMWQLLNGLAYLHTNWVMHRDLKPANILVSRDGVVKIGDLGLARLYTDPMVSFYSSDMVVVTIWYRAPELLLGARHYTTAIDMWAVGCIWGELVALRPMFKGEEVRMDPKTKGVPFQGSQFSRIVDVLGAPGRDRWRKIDTMPEFPLWVSMKRSDAAPKSLYAWYTSRTQATSGYDLFDRLLQYDPERRISASDALKHSWFAEEPLPTMNVFASLPGGGSTYPRRKVTPPENQQKIGVGLVSAGVLFLVLGVILFFDATLLALGNVLFTAGIAMLIGPRKTFMFFARKNKIRGTVCFFLGMFLVFCRYAITGMAIEMVGFLNLFGDFFPVILNFMRQVPIIGDLLTLPVVRQVMDQLAGARRSTV